MLLNRIFAACRLAAVSLVAVSAAAQPPSPNARTVEFGHIHLNSADPDSAIAFWKDVIGASDYSNATVPGASTKGVSMIGATILFSRTTPSGPSTGSGIDHIGLKVPDLQPFVEKLAKTSYKSFQPPGGGDDRLMIDGPDGMRIELTEDNSMYAKLEFHHIHFHTAQPKDMQTWYEKNFGARRGSGEEADSSLIRGAALTFSPADSALPTAGRAIDHIAFKVNNLEAFCQTLSGNGIKFDSPSKPAPESKPVLVFLTDPWGTRIELTEGLKN